MKPFAVYAPGLPSIANSDPWVNPTSYIYLQGVEALQLKLTNFHLDGSIYFTSFGPAVNSRGEEVGLFIGTIAGKPPGSVARVPIVDDDGNSVQVIKLIYDGKRPIQSVGEMTAMAEELHSTELVTEPKAVGRSPTLGTGSRYVPREKK